MALKPTDIPRPRVASPDAALARPTGVRLPRIVDNRGEATSQAAGALQRKAAATRGLAQDTLQAGEGIAQAEYGLGRVTGESGRMVAAAQEQFAKTIGGIGTTFELIEKNRQEAADSVYADTWQLEAAKAGTAVEADHLNSPKEGREYVEDLDQKLASTYEGVTKAVTLKLGYEPSDSAKEKITSYGYNLRTDAARRSAVAANTARTVKLVETANSNVMDIAREAGGSGDLADGLTKADASIDTLTGVLPEDKLNAARSAARETVVENVVLGHLQRNELDEARTIVDAITGFAGPASNDVHKAIIGSFKNEGVDPLVGLAISRRETGGSFDPQSVTFTDPKTGKPASSASGLFHMTNATARYYLGGPGASTEGVLAQADAGAKLTADNIRGLRRALNGEPTPGEIYLAHVLGLGNAVQIATSDPATPLAKILSPKEIANSAPRLKNATVGDMLQWATEAMQTNMQAVVDAGIIDGRDVPKNLAGVPVQTGIRLGGAVAAKEKQLLELAEKQRKEFLDAFTPVKPRTERDPAAYVFNYTPEVRKAYSVAAGLLADENATPEQKGKAWTGAMASSIAEQKALGISERDAKVLPIDQAKTLVNKLIEAKGPDAVKQFYELRDLAGPYWDKMFGELVDQKLPPEFQVLGLLNPVTDPAQVNSVAQVLNISAEDLKKDLGTAGSTVEADLLKPIEDDLADFRQAFEFGPFSGGKDQAAAIIGAAQKVALNRYRLTGNINKAKDEAKALIREHVMVMNGGNVNAVIPTDTRLTEGQIEAATEFMQGRQRIENFDPLTIGVPVAPLPSEGLLTPGNINLASRPVVKNPDGTISTVRSMSINVDGKEILIPTVADDGRLLSKDEAVAQYRETGKNLGIFDTPEHANTYARALHNQQAEFYGLRRDRTRNAAHSFGKWATNDKGDGLTLLVPLGNGTAYTRLFNARGEPYEIKFIDIPDLAKKGLAERAPPADQPRYAGAGQ